MLFISNRTLGYNIFIVEIVPPNKYFLNKLFQNLNCEVTLTELLNLFSNTSNNMKVYLPPSLTPERMIAVTV